MNKFLLAPLLSFVLSGCANVYQIGKEDSFNNAPGIPFYVKSAKLNQMTVRERVWLDVTITREDVDADDKVIAGSKPDLKTYHIAKSSYNQVKFKTLLSSVTKPNDDNTYPSFAKVVALIDGTLSQCDSTSINQSNPTNHNLVISEAVLHEQLAIKATDTSCMYDNLVSNKQEYKDYIDYSIKYYYNANMPWFGSSEATIELNESGTLKTSTAKADNTKTGDVIPFREYLAKRWGVSGLLTTEFLDQPKKRYTVSEVVKGRSYTLSKELDKDSKIGDPLKFSDAEIQIITASVGGQESDKPANKEEDKKSIKINGAIVLPD